MKILVMPARTLRRLARKIGSGSARVGRSIVGTGSCRERQSRPDGAPAAGARRTGGTTFGLGLIAVLVFSAGCDRDPMSERGFRLPDGDAVAGREAFLYMQCNQCHTIEGEELPRVPDADPPYVELGGAVTRVKTYGELVTAIINPSHKLADGYAEDVVSVDGESKMYVYNGYMTVQELIDIVMYLQPHYDVVVPEFHYRVYP